MGVQQFTSIKLSSYEHLLRVRVGVRIGFEVRG